MVNDYPYRQEANITVVKRLAAELKDICLHTGVCVRKEWAEQRANGTLAGSGTNFDSYYNPHVVGSTTSPASVSNASTMPTKPPTITTLTPTTSTIAPYSREGWVEWIISLPHKIFQAVAEGIASVLRWFRSLLGGGS